MAISPNQIIYRLSNPSASGGNSSPQVDPNASLGGQVSTTVLAGGANTLFDNITGARNEAMAVDYRCVFVMNTNPTDTLFDAVLWIDQAAGGADVEVALDNIGPVAADSTSAQAATIPNPSATPTGVGQFSTPADRPGGLVIGDLGAGQVKAIWLRRSAQDTGAVDDDSVTLFVAGDTGE